MAQAQGFGIEGQAEPGNRRVNLSRAATAALSSLS
jgi:hypothetical protein